MKKLWIVLAFTAFAAGSLFSVEIDDDWYKKHSDSIKDGNLLINAGFSLGWWGIGGAAALDYVLPGTPFTLGGGVGFSYWEVLKGNDDINYTHVFIPLSFRFAWHPYLGVPNLDAYALASLTPTIDIYSYPVPDEYNSTTFKWSYKKETEGNLWWWTLINIGLGARYYFTPQLGAFLELGYGINAFVIGVTFKL